jgi:molybdopterin biosynthesis enzyme
VKAEALRGSRLNADGIDGAVLAQTLLVPDDHHRVLLLKGRILSKADWPVVAAARVDELHVVRMEPGDVHEDEAARRLAKVVAGPGVIVHGPVESQARLSAEVNGIFKVDVQRLQALNSIEDVSVFTLFDGQLVSKGKTIAGVKVTPFVVPEARLGQAEGVAAAGEGVIRVLAFRPMRVAVLVRERLEPAQREKFQASIEMKVAWFGSSISEIRYVADDVETVEAAVSGLLRSADLLLTAGANATDPLDPTLVALGRLGAQMEKQGAPAHPGSAVWLAYVTDKPIFGVAACGMFSKATVLDLILPRLFTGARVTADDFNGLGHGGLLSKDMAFRFPPYGAFDTLDS